ncbi:SMI1/KNR4 family protein [Vibrio atypicus]|uniref:SMI1/KNR4 family protein n=1 Tax=Vibrio atypicus TaxID=558271 RepID=UPI003734F499
MKELEQLVEDVKSNGQEIFWLGKTSVDQINKLEELLNIKLPDSFRKFLRVYGGGGVVGSEISGIEDNNAELDYGGTIYGDTLVCREDYDLPEHLIIIFFKDDEICWCLDYRNMDLNKEPQVVSYNLFKKNVDRIVADDFEQFFNEYLVLRSN